MKEGPNLQIIPEQRIYTCWGCKWYNHQMVQSGRNPKYETTCLKLDHTGKPIEEDNESINNILLFHFDLSNSDETPQCCPFLKSQIREDKINNIIKDK